MRRRIQFALAGVALVCAAFAHAQTWPVKPVSMINPFAPGGGVDGCGRPLAAYLSKTLGQQFLVENMARPVTAPRTISQASCSRRWPASTSRISRTRAQAR